MLRPADKFSRRDVPCCGGGRNTQAEGTPGERPGRAGRTVAPLGHGAWLRPRLRWTARLLAPAALSDTVPTHRSFPGLRVLGARTSRAPLRATRGDGERGRPEPVPPEAEFSIWTAARGARSPAGGAGRCTARGGRGWGRRWASETQHPARRAPPAPNGTRFLRAKASFRSSRGGSPSPGSSSPVWMPSTYPSLL